jgi:hypothetical protein
MPTSSNHFLPKIEKSLLKEKIVKKTKSLATLSDKSLMISVR